jgi:hypothetical protein
MTATAWGAVCAPAPPPGEILEPRAHQLLTAREPAAHHPAALLGHPHRIELAGRPQLRQRARVKPVGLRPCLADPRVIRAHDDHPAQVRLEDPGDLPRAAGYLQGHPIPMPEADREQLEHVRRRLDPPRRSHHTLLADVEHTYKRGGALTYLAAWDVRHGQVFGRSERKGGIAPFDRLVHQVMTKEPYASAPRVFWIVDNGSSHRGQASVRRLQGRWPNLVLVHTPVHASWLNQVEIYFSIIQRKVLTPNDFDSLAAVAKRLNDFEQLHNQIAQSFGWKLSRNDLGHLLTRLTDRQARQPALAA